MRSRGRIWGRGGRQGGDDAGRATTRRATIGRRRRRKKDGTWHGMAWTTDAATTRPRGDPATDLVDDLELELHVTPPSARRAARVRGLQVQPDVLVLPGRTLPSARADGAVHARVPSRVQRQPPRASRDANDVAVVLAPALPRGEEPIDAPVYDALPRRRGAGGVGFVHRAARRLVARAIPGSTGFWSGCRRSFRCVLRYKSFSPIDRFQHLIASPFN
jgi:hypothetical protein